MATTAAIARERSCTTATARMMTTAATTGSTFSRPVTGSRLVGRPLAEQPVGPEDQDDDEDREHDRVGPARGDVLVAPRGQKADEEAAEGGAAHAADPAEYGGGEGAQPGLVAHPPHADVVVHALDQPRRPRQRTADEERDQDRALDVDAHRLRRLAALRRCAHRLAPARAPDEVGERDHERDGGDDDEHVLGGEEDRG